MQNISPSGLGILLIYLFKQEKIPLLLVHRCAAFLFSSNKPRNTDKQMYKKKKKASLYRMKKNFFPVWTLKLVL